MTSSRSQISVISSHTSLIRYLKRELAFCGCGYYEEALLELKFILSVAAPLNGAPMADKSALLEKLSAAPGISTWMIWLLDHHRFIDHGFSIDYFALTTKGKGTLTGLEKYLYPSADRFLKKISQNSQRPVSFEYLLTVLWQALILNSEQLGTIPNTIVGYIDTTTVGSNTSIEVGTQDLEIGIQLIQDITQDYQDEETPTKPTAEDIIELVSRSLNYNPAQYIVLPINSKDVAISWTSSQASGIYQV